MEPFTSNLKDNSTLATANADLLSELAQQRKIETLLHEQQEQLAGIISSAMDAILTVDAAQRVTIFNTAAEKMFGYSAAEALGQPLDRFIPDRYRAAHRQHIEGFGKTSVTRRSMRALGEVFGLRRNREEFQVEASISQVQIGGEKFYTVILRDITNRRAAEERLQEQAALLDHAQDSIIVRDLEQRILFWNRSAEKLYGWSKEEVLNRDICERVFQGNTDELQKATQTALNTGEWRGELHQKNREGKPIVVEGRWKLVRDNQGQPKSILITNTDITEKKKLEAQFLRAQRMESIGTLAGGIAHDLNNILSPIMLSVQMLQLKTSDEASLKMLEILQTNAERGSGMIKQILSFARGVSGERVSVQLKHLIKEIAKILKETLPRSIEIKPKIPDELWLINGDATQLHQVLMNLCINARDALPDGGTVSLVAENCVVDETYAEMAADAKPGRYVRVIVTDNGTGIKPENLARIFDPFFTTKEVGHGTGLGLSTVLGIVKGHHGFINVYSEPGKGSEFRIYLPAQESSHPHLNALPSVEMPRGHSELILVVDDEAAIRQIAQTTLEAFNYRVLTASDGAEAIALFAQHRDEIKAVLTDLMMPLMDGVALIRALRKLSPDVRIIASSGLASNGKTAEVSDEGAQAFLPKPYTASLLLQTLARVLNMPEKGNG
ncbi:MAG: PAS domain S-box protein [Acidobacteria bacterium]|nr:PAS domain S-box protein [Acidobacteriota bacterium]